MWSQDKPNEYFQQEPYFNSQSDHSRGRNFFFTENSYLIDFKEPLSLCLSENNHFIPSESEQKVQPTAMPTRTTDPAHGAHPPSTFLEHQDAIQFNEASLDRYKEIYQGTKDDTVELNTNFKTILVNFFKELLHAKQLNEEEISDVTEFIGRVPSFQSLKKLFRKDPSNRRVRKWCLQLFSSSDCAKRVMASKCRLKTKMTMIKFIEKVRLNILRPDKIIRWKEVVKTETGLA